MNFVEIELYFLVLKVISSTSFIKLEIAFVTKYVDQLKI